MSAPPHRPQCPRERWIIFRKLHGHVMVIKILSTPERDEADSEISISRKRENRRMSSIRAAETRAEAMPVDEKESIKEDEIETVNEREQLYMDVLCAISNSVGCQQPGSQVKPHKYFEFFAFNVFHFLAHSLLTTKKKCTPQHRGRSASHLTDIFACSMRLARRNPRLLSYR